MIVVYTPEGEEPQHYDATKLRTSEAVIVQRTVDKTWQEILKGLESDDLDAMRGIVWVLRKRSEPSLRWADCDPGVTELTTRMSNKEVEQVIRDAFDLSKAGDEVTPDMVADILRARVDQVAVDPEYAFRLIDTLAAEGKAETEAAPDRAPDGGAASEVAGGSPSPTSSGPETSTSGSSLTSSTSLQPESTTSPSPTSTP
ncbi:hypothetical protein ACIPPM_22150 [Streptomyces sp. NPDC090119]|uniref:hypothetical protein n=1 Tax=Streptomyces sp. NPDC090119 TaxID=3365951 RepID=UPI00380B1C2E